FWPAYPVKRCTCNILLVTFEDLCSHSRSMKRHGPKAPPRKEIKHSNPVPPRSILSVDTLFAVLLGTFFGLCLLKFGNPPIMEKYVEPPTNIFEFLAMAPWPLGWAYCMLGFLAILGTFFAISHCRRRRKETHSEKTPAAGQIASKRAPIAPITASE